MSNKPFLSLMLASGGDSRIIVPNGHNTNRYGASPYPRATLGYASSTANDISLAAFGHLEGLVSGWPRGALTDRVFYAEALERQRYRIRKAWSLPDVTDVVFAPSGTDLELAALALAKARSGKPVTNILLGQDEVGSGCVLAAAGRFFASETALELHVEKGLAVDGLEDTELVNIPIRDASGHPHDSAVTTSRIRVAGRDCIRSGRHVLMHVVHGSKTGLVLPKLSDIDELRDEFGHALSVVVDACQARIDRSAIQGYLDRGAMVMLSGSKFMGGPPFSGFLLVPQHLLPRRKVASGLTRLFRRAEWPMRWQCADHLTESSNPGLLLRLEASLFELDRYAMLGTDRRIDVFDSFGLAVRNLSYRLGADLVEPALAGMALHEATLATLDFSTSLGQPDFATAQRWCRVLAARGLRLGQPVKYRKLDNGEWAGTLRISLSMPLTVELSILSPAQRRQKFERDMGRIADVLEAASRPVVA
jgi:selenocysteine lyase/cysteine desulfurase